MNEAITSICVKVYTFLLPISWLALVIAIFVLVPMALFKRTRPQAGIGLFIASWLFGITTWTLGATVTFVSFGWIGFLIGVIFLGVGVVPIAIFAAFILLKSLSLGVSLIVMAIIVFGCRYGGAILMESSN
ncbi:MAG: hypothetical protein JYX80_03595 [Candidatus Scalindua sediminis]|nr:hypothetical protein [Candidatus Scalindua sediminis]